MDPITLGLVSMGVGGATKFISDIFDPTAGRQADLLRKQADLKLGALNESMSRAFGQQTQLLSSTKARMAGTGFDESSGSFTGYIKTMASTFEQQNAYTRASGLASIDLMRQAADQLDDPTAKILRGVTDLAGLGFQAASVLKPADGTV
jgi:hypothetical protein